VEIRDNSGNRLAVILLDVRRGWSATRNPKREWSQKRIAKGSCCLLRSGLPYATPKYHYRRQSYRKSKYSNDDPRYRPGIIRHLSTRSMLAPSGMNLTPLIHVDAPKSARHVTTAPAKILFEERRRRSACGICGETRNLDVLIDDLPARRCSRNPRSRAKPSNVSKV